ncbi:hypothetical protein [Mycobacterium sp. URHB0021]
MISAAVVVNVIAVAATAAITYALSNHEGGPPASSTPSSPAPVKTYSAAEQSAAKDGVCHTFDTNQRGSAGQGGLIDRGQLNVPVVLRAVNGVVALQNALSPASPSELTSAVKDYVSTTLDLTSAALANAPVEELNRLNDVGNAATYALADVCGLPH